jgi:hypothetical protein
MMTSVLKLTYFNCVLYLYKNVLSQSASTQTRGLSHMTKFCVAPTFDDVSTIWVYKANITRMVGRLFVSRNGSVRAECRDSPSRKL